MTDLERLERAVMLSPLEMGALRADCAATFAARGDPAFWLEYDELSPALQSTLAVYYADWIGGVWHAIPGAPQPVDVPEIGR